MIVTLAPSPHAARAFRFSGLQLSGLERLAAVCAQVNQALNSEITPQARIVSTLSQFGPGRIWVTGRGVEAGYRIARQVTVAVNPF